MISKWAAAALIFGSVLLAGVMPAPVEAAEGAQAADGKETAINLTTDDGVAVYGVYRAGRKGGPGVILLHQSGRDHEDWSFFADSLQRGGYHVVAIDFRGHGKSLRKGDATLSVEGLQPADYQAMTRDVAAAAAWLRARPDVDSGRIAVVGASLGANVALAYGAEDPRISQVVLLSPGLDYKGVASEEAIARYGDRPLFMAVSREDSYSAKSVLVLDSTSTSTHKEMKVFTGAGHGIKMLSREPSLESAILTWLNGPVDAGAAVGGPPTVPAREGAPDAVAPQ